MKNRYTIEKGIEGNFQKGSNQLVLANKLNITSKQEMDDVELSLLKLLYTEVYSSVSINQIITTRDICQWHKKWLGNVYQWAGNFRNVNMSKNNFHFALSRQIPYLMNQLDEKFLTKLTACNAMKIDNLINSLAVVHIEFILIHPFREGNGRIARLLANVMALQANLPELDFSYFDKNKGDYFKANQIGLSGNYEPLKSLFKQVLHDSEKNYSS